MEDRRYENKDINPEREQLKVGCCDNNVRAEDRSFIDQIWNNYTERPLLPLKPLRKSRSCTSLVQTIKGFSIRKTSTTQRYSSPEFQENAFTDKRERYASDASVSKGYRTKETGMEEEKIRSMSDAVQHPAEKDVAWYHPVDAREASKRLLSMHQNGAFLIRPASNPSAGNFYTLCVVFSGCVYNFRVRNLKNGLISIGNREGQKTFSSLLGMIRYHQNVPIPIHLAESDSTAHVLLLLTPSKGK